MPILGVQNYIFFLKYAKVEGFFFRSTIRPLITDHQINRQITDHTSQFTIKKKLSIAK